VTNPVHARHWAVLGIDPCSDAASVKRAYARRLKVVRPDDDAQAFQELRRAYEWALDFVNGAAPAAPSSAPPAASAEPLQSQPASPTIPDFRPPQVVQVHRQARPVEPPAPPQPSPPPLPTPATLAAGAWRSFLAATAGLAQAAAERDPAAPIDTEVAAIKEQLVALLRQPELESLEVRARLGQLALQYAAQESAAPAVRIACFEALGWEGMGRFPGAQTPDYQVQALNRAVADTQFNQLANRARRSAAVKALLAAGPTRIPWLRLYKESFGSEMRQCLQQVRSSMPEVELYRLGRERVEVWADAAFRPWPGTLHYLIAILIGVLGIGMLPESRHLTAILVGALPMGMLVDPWLQSLLSQRTGDIVATVLSGLGMLLPLALVLLYPRYLYRPLSRRLDALRARRETPLALWAAQVLLSTLAFSLYALPEPYGRAFIALAAAGAVCDIVLRGSFKGNYLIFLLMMGAFVAYPLLGATQPFVGPAAVFMPLLIQALFFSLQGITSMYGMDWRRAQPRLAFLGGGILLALAEYRIAPLAPVAAAMAAIAGWLWVLAATGATDIFCLRLAHAKGQFGALRWFVALGVLLYLPQNVHFDSPVAGMLRLQATVALSLTADLIAQALLEIKAAWRRRREARAAARQ
jgi:hypothetical protein